jgi:periplasmic protein CpxP/Spy
MPRSTFSIEPQRIRLVTLLFSVCVVASAHSQPTAAPERVVHNPEQRINHLAKAVDATPEQKDKLNQLSKAAMADMQPLQTQHQAARQQGMQLLAATTIDRSALEQSRVRQMGVADAMSQRRLKLMMDMAEVLTPAQRSKLAELMQRKAHGARHDRYGGEGGFWSAK